MTILTHYFAIANGKDNEAGLKRLPELVNGLFRFYTADILTEWHPFMSRLTGGLGDTRDIGRSWSAIVPYDLTAVEYSYLTVNFGQDVTIRSLNKTINKWFTANAKFKPPTEDKEPELGHWYNPRFEFRFLEMLTVET